MEKLLLHYVSAELIKTIGSHVANEPLRAIQASWALPETSFQKTPLALIHMEKDLWIGKQFDKSKININRHENVTVEAKGRKSAWCAFQDTGFSGRGKESIYYVQAPC